MQIIQDVSSQVGDIMSRCRIESSDSKLIMAIATGAVVALSTLFFTLRGRRRRMQHNITNGPRFKDWAFNKGLYMLLFKNRQLGEWILESVQRYGELFRFSVFGRQAIFVANTEIMRQILHQRDLFPNDSIFRLAVGHRSGTTMFISEGERWKKKHDLLQPLMSRSVLCHASDRVHPRVLKFLQCISESQPAISSPSEFTIEIISYLKRLTVDVIGEFAFGVDLHAIDYDVDTSREDTRFSFHANAVLRGINMRLIFPSVLWWLPLPVWRNEKRSQAFLMRMFDDILTVHQNKRQNGDLENNNLVSIMLSIHEKYPEEAKLIYPKEEMLAECFSIWSAGHDTTTYTVGFILKMLSQNPRVQSKLRDEILAYVTTHPQNDDNNDDSPSFPSYDDINKLRYLDSVIRETQRLYPVAPLLTRESAEDVTINNVNFPKNSFVVLCLEALQKKEEYYKDCLEFVPERWEEADVSESPFFSFGFGIRSCFGRKFALLEMKCTLFHLLQKYEIVDNSKTHPLKTELEFGCVPIHKVLPLQFRALKN